MKEFEDKIKTYLEERGWDNLKPGDIAKSIMIEGGELLELFQWENLTQEELKNKPEKVEKIKKELADVMIYCFDLAVSLEIDTKEILESSLEKIKEKYPADLFNKDKNAKDPGSEDIYWEIKNKYRKGE